MNGIVANRSVLSTDGALLLIKDNVAKEVPPQHFVLPGEVNGLIAAILDARGHSEHLSAFETLFFELVEPNVQRDATLTEKALNDALAGISLTRGTVDEGKLIIAKGEVVERDNLKVLDSLKAEYESELWTNNGQYFILFGYTILVALVLIMLLLFLKKYRPVVYGNNTKVTFIFFNILFMTLLTTMVVNYDDQLVFVVPLCILPSS